MFQNFKNVRLSEQICFQEQPFQRFRQVQAELCVVLLHQAINVVHLRAKRRTIRNYQNLLGFHWEDLLFDIIFSCRRDTDNAVFLADFCKQLIPGICILCQQLFNTFQLHIAGCQRIIDRVRLVIGSLEAAGGLFQFQNSVYAVRQGAQIFSCDQHVVVVRMLNRTGKVKA